MAVRDLLKGRKYNQNKAVEGFGEVNNSRTPRAAHQSGYGRAAAPHHGGHPALREDAAAAAEPGDRDRVCGRHDCAVVRERAHPAGATRDPERPSSGLTGRPGLCAGRVLQPRAPLGKVARAQLPHGAHAAVHGASSRLSASASMMSLFCQELFSLRISPRRRFRALLTFRREDCTQSHRLRSMRSLPQEKP